VVVDAEDILVNQPVVAAAPAVVNVALADALVVATVALADALAVTQNHAKVVAVDVDAQADAQADVLAVALAVTQNHAKVVDAEDVVLQNVLHVVHAVQADVFQLAKK
jgi:hypothetical protein